VGLAVIGSLGLGSKADSQKQLDGGQAGQCGRQMESHLIPSYQTKIEAIILFNIYL
jgi:hypothetical protein